MSSVSVLAAEVLHIPTNNKTRNKQIQKHKDKNTNTKRTNEDENNNSVRAVQSEPHKVRQPRSCYVLLSLAGRIRLHSGIRPCLLTLGGRRTSKRLGQDRGSGRQGIITFPRQPSKRLTQLGDALSDDRRA